MDDMFEAFTQLRLSLNTAFAAADGFVAESRRVSDELRKEGCDVKANSLAGWADEWEPVTTPLFRKAATGIVELVSSAFINAYPVHVLEVERPLLGRDRAEWGRLCTSQRYLFELEDQERSEGREPFAIELIDELTTIDDHAEVLTVEQIIEAATGSTTTGSGFAAKLACLCGAWEYGAGDQEKAQRAIDKAMKGAS
jgi:hypothetical protein